MSISLIPVHQKLSTLSSTSSTLKKIELLQTYLKDPLFHRVIRLAYNQTYSYNVSTFPEYKQIGFCDRGWEFVLPILKELVQRQGADNAIKQKLFQAASIDKETYEIVARICDGDLKCGIGARLINIAIPNTVKIFSYMRCATSKHFDKIVYPAQAQCKADGSFANLIIDADRNVEFITRSGQKVKCLQHLKSKIKSQKPLKKYGTKRGILHHHLNAFASKVFNGELRVFRPDGSIMPRKMGNGIINQCIKGTVDPEVAKRIFYTAWDCVDLDKFYDGFDGTAQQTRFFSCIQLVDCVGDSKAVQLVKHQMVESYEEAIGFYRKMRAEDEEGSVTKNLKGIWEDNQSGSHDCIKAKHSFECEVKITAWKYGKKGTKYENCIGAFQYSSECGKLVGWCSGITDEEREWEWDMMIDSICTVEAESVIESKSKSTYSLYTPSFIEIREDKRKADTLEEILEICKESKKTKRHKA